MILNTWSESGFPGSHAGSTPPPKGVRCERTLLRSPVLVSVILCTCACLKLTHPALFTLLGLRMSSLRRGHANLLCIVPILTDDPRRESNLKLTHQTCLWLGANRAAPTSLRSRPAPADRTGPDRTGPDRTGPDRTGPDRTELDRTILYYTIQYNTILYYTILYYAMLNYTTLHYTLTLHCTNRSLLCRAQPSCQTSRSPREDPCRIGTWQGATAIFVLKIPGSRFRKQQTNVKIPCKASGDHLPIQDSSRLSIEVSGIVSRTTAILRASSDLAPPLPVCHSLSAPCAPPYTPLSERNAMCS